MTSDAEPKTTMNAKVARCDGEKSDDPLSQAFLTELQHDIVSSSVARPYEHDPEKGFTMDIMMMMDMEKVLFLSLWTPADFD
ncbi:hypothetical protein PINS_up013961 [Pythium insidiosum]|nr:hypothetical protein PINS_up013961 [Pythium insidiosum]